MNDFITPFFLAVIWATLGCTIIRLFWQSTYDRICAFWLLTVFSFTFFNRIVVLTYFDWPINIIVSSLAVFGPVISHFKYRFDSSIEGEAETLHQLLYGVFLLASSVVLTFVTKKIIGDMLEISNNSIGETGFSFVILILVALGILGLFMIYLSRKVSQTFG